MAGFIGNLSLFDHNTQDWAIFSSRLKQFLILNVIEDDMRRAVLLTHVHDETYRLLKNLVYPKNVEEVGYDELLKVLDGHFTPRRCTFADKSKFYEATREVGESVEQWAARVRGLAVHCEFGNSLDMLLRDKFVLGLRAGKERERLFEQDATTLTLAKAVELAQQAECAQQARAAAVAVTVKQEPMYRARAQLQPSASGRDLARTCSVCGMKSHDASKCRYKNYRCQLCGEKGHLKKICTSKKLSKCHVHNVEEREEKSECDNCKECELLSLRYVNYKPILLHVSVNNTQLNMELDSGSGTTIVCDKLYNRLFPSFPLSKSDLCMCLYNGHKITPIGYFVADVTYMEKTQTLRIYVIENGGPPILGRDFMTKFNMSLTVDNKFVNMEQSSSEVTKLLNQFSSLFEDRLGTFNKFKVHLQLKDNVTPKYFKPRSVPFALKKRVEEEIDRLVDLGILVPVNYSEFATPIVPVLKQNGKIKIAGDYSVTLNKDMHIDKYPMPRIEEVFANLGGGQSYSKLDLSNAYNQFVLSDSSQALTTISTTKGLYMYTRLLYGLANAPAVFQRAMESLLVGIEGVSCWLDDVCITGPTDDVHLARLREVLSRLSDAGLKLQKEKCVFFSSSVTYLGYVINKDGLQTCPKKVEAVYNAPRPTNVTEVKRFLGVVNYYRSFIPNASNLLSPLHELLRAEAKWDWGRPQEEAFEAVKRKLCSERVLAHFDPEAQLVLSVDAGPGGLGAILAQRDPCTGAERPLAFASRSLNASERNYSQIQKEATAIIFGVKRFHQYLYGRQDPFILKTDHRPLLSIFGKKNGISVMTASRLQRYAIILSAYNYNVQYISSANNLVADFFSRAPLPDMDNEVTEDDEVSYLRFLDESVAPVTADKIKEATENDATLKKVFKYMSCGWPRKISCASILPYFRCKADLQIDNGCLFRGHRIVIPSVFRTQLLSDLHVGHLGIVKTKSIARGKMWWPNIDADIERWIGSCAACTAVRSAPPRAAPAPWPRPPGAWYRVHIDYMSIHNRTYLIIVDAYSKWLECLLMNNGTTTRALICKLKEVFSRYGVPNVIVSDNDVKINSTEFNSFCAMNGIRYVTSPVYHPASNGQAENSVKTCKKMIKCIDTNQSQVEDKLLGFLFQYRNTPHCSTGRTPASLMIGRNLRSRLDLVLPGDNSKSGIVNDEKTTCREFNVGDKIWIKWFTAKKEIWTLGTIQNKIGNRMYLVFVHASKSVCRRHIDQILRYTGADIDGINVSTADGADEDAWSPPPVELPPAPSPASSPAAPAPSSPPSPRTGSSVQADIEMSDDYDTGLSGEDEVSEEPLAPTAAVTEVTAEPTAEVAPAPAVATSARSPPPPPMITRPTLRPRLKKINYRT